MPERRDCKRGGCNIVLVYDGERGGPMFGSKKREERKEEKRSEKQERKEKRTEHRKKVLDDPVFLAMLDESNNREDR